MKKTSSYEMLYRKNESTGRIMIDVALEDYNEFFHEWDNAAFRKRDIHTELAQFLDLCSEDIPLSKKLEIVFSVNTVEIRREKEDQIRSSYRNYYGSLYRLERKKVKHFVRFSAALLFTSLVMLSAYTLLSDEVSGGFVSKVLLESLLIGCWVFTWEAVHLLFLDIIDPFHRRREIKRFIDAKLNFQYAHGPLLTL
jgi:hypothetical protein